MEHTPIKHYYKHINHTSTNFKLNLIKPSYIKSDTEPFILSIRHHQIVKRVGTTNYQKLHICLYSAEKKLIEPKFINKLPIDILQFAW